MMGRQSAGQVRFFYSFNRDERVPETQFAAAGLIKGDGFSAMRALSKPTPAAIMASPRKRSDWSTRTAKANKRVQFGYWLNYLIDNEHAVIVDVAPPARTFDEVQATAVLIERTEQRFGLKPKRFAADTAYGTGKFLGWLAKEKIAPHIPVWDKGKREDGTFS
jgi:hypothetical protein